jgi:Family of unknown function (DUF5677)
MALPGMHQSYEGPKLAPERAWLMVGYQRAISLARERLPLMISPDGNPSPQEDWRVIRAAFVARITRTAEALSALVPVGARLDGMDLVRNLLEHGVCLAWIAADAEDRLGVWLKRDYQGRIKFDNAIRDRIAKGTEPRWSEEPLAQADRAYYARHVQRVKANLPRMRDMCVEADRHWLSRYPAGLADHRRMSFLNDYDYIYDTYSWMAHPRLTGLQAFWDFQRQWTVVHAEETGDRSHDPLHMGQLLAGHGLLVSAMATGVPNVDEVIELLNSNAELARLVRDGKVVTEEVSPGRFELELSYEVDA